MLFVGHRSLHFLFVVAIICAAIFTIFCAAIDEGRTILVTPININSHPIEDKNANLRVIDTLRDRYNCDVGYSGHEVGLAISTASAALSITSLERHITMNRAMYGSDQPASVEPSGFKSLVGAVRKIKIAMGDGKKTVLEEETSIAAKFREHIS